MINEDQKRAVRAVVAEDYRKDGLTYAAEAVERGLADETLRAARCAIAAVDRVLTAMWA